MYNEIDLEERTYICLVNTDIPMSIGKSNAQIFNVAVQLPRLPLSNNKLMDNVSRTYNFGATEEEMMFFLKFFGEELDIKWTVDSGNTTEYTYGVLTCIGWKRKCIEYKALTNHLNLYGKVE
jgi:hypothetical protein